MYRFFFLIIILGVHTVQAQLRIEGTVTDGNQHPVIAANISLLRNDSSWVLSATTDETGRFQLPAPNPGRYFVVAQAVGFARMMQLVEIENQHVNLQLQLQSQTQLQEVIVSSKEPRIETSPGKTTINLEQIHTMGNSVWDLLRKSPGVNVSTGNITLQGVPVLVLIDDKPTYLAGRELEDYFKSLSADQVASLELMTQPSSKYDAEGSGGIINIKTRKIRKRGLNGNIALQYGQTVYPNTHNSASLTYRNDRMTLTVQAGQMTATGFLNREDLRKVSDVSTGALVNETAQSIFMKETFSDYNLKTGVDYDLTDKTTVGVNVKGIYHPNVQKDLASATVKDGSGQTVYNSTVNTHDFERSHYLCNAYLKYKPAKDHELSFDADYIYRNQRENHHTTGRNFDGQANPVSGDLDLDNQTLSVIDVVTARADYSGVLSNGLKSEAGIKFSQAKVDNGAYFQTLQNGHWVNDATRTNHFIYRERISAAYLNVSKALGKKWEVQAGVRAEHMRNEGTETQQGGSFQRSTLSLFPTAFVSCKLDEKNTLELSFGRRINRPAYTMMSPFITYFSQYYYHKGNPDLSPSFRNYLELRYNCDNQIFASAGFRKVSNYITPILGYDAANSATYATWGNYAIDYVVQLSLSYHKQLVKWWQLSTTGDAYYNKFFTAAGHQYLNSSLGASLHIQNRFELARGWSIDTTFFYATGDLQNVIDRYGSSYWFGFDLAKKMFHNSATLKLSVEDPFRQYRINSTSSWNGIETRSNLRYGSQSVALGFTYNFGKKMDGATPRKTNNEEAGRM
jgi:iron complex outermembrane recepter protein